MPRQRRGLGGLRAARPPAARAARHVDASQTAPTPPPHSRAAARAARGGWAVLSLIPPRGGPGRASMRGWGGGGASGAGGQMLVREAECHDTASLRPGAAARQRAGWLEGACTGGRDSEPSRAGPRSRPQWHSVGRADLEEHQSLPASRAGPACWRPRPRAPPCPPLCK